VTGRLPPSSPGRPLHQLPVSSPIDLQSILASLGHRDDADALCAHLGGSHRVRLTDSGTSALALALRASAKARGGLPVALPAYACYDLGTAALAAGVRVRFYDVDPDTLGPDETTLRHAIHAGVSCVVLVHPYGIPQDAPMVSNLARGAGAFLIEDLAQADGAQVSGEPLGRAADYIVRSFGRGKGWTGGGGGALLVAEDAPAPAQATASVWSTAQSARFTLSTLAQWGLGRPALYAIPSAFPPLGLGETRFKQPTESREMHPSQVRLAVATAHLQEAERAHRRRTAEYYNAIDIESFGWLRPAVAAGADCGWLRYPLRGALPTHESWRSLGIARGYPKALPHLSALAQITIGRGSILGAEELARSLWTLPTHGHVTDRWRARILRWLAGHAPAARKTNGGTD
jgi:dTDP-4-amino-4,6-dideoxygalactose transaminase